MSFCSTNRPLESLGQVVVRGVGVHRGAQGRETSRSMKRVGAWSLQGHMACKGMRSAEAWNVEERGAYIGVEHEGA